MSSHLAIEQQRLLGFGCGALLMALGLLIVCQRQAAAHAQEHDTGHGPRLLKVLRLPIASNTLELVHWKGRAGDMSDTMRVSVRSSIVCDGEPWDGTSLQ